ncbi:putative binding-protein-dependent transport system protein [Vulgatibacter incomptus]|uniref:Putative binding-protein-dependent transport system protein n=2 Tax=Vulgatibacter incomptus TaxID=1391653 RepID=A0A0K1PJ12_9BACT|nr:putative binding-protein-dependent transport system protein [Vulgatibacter incomptus]
MVHLPAMLAVSGVGVIALGVLVVGRDGRFPRVGWLPLALLGVCAAIALQLVPLPPGALRLIAPETARVAELTLFDGSGSWRPITLDRPATAAELAKWLGWAAIAMVFQHRAATARGARQRLLLYVAITAGVVAAVGLGHFFAGEKRSLFGLYEFQAANPIRSTFGNRNHLAGFLNLGGLIALGLAAATERRWMRIAWAASFVACAAGTVLSASRGGFVGLVAGVVLVPALAFGSGRRRESEGWRSWLTLGAASALAGGVAVWIYLEFPRILTRIATILALDPENDEAKLEALSSGWRAAKAGGLAGIGKGAFETAGRLYQEKPFPGMWFTHVENEPVQALAELGFVVGGLLLVVIGVAWLGLAVRGRKSWAEAGAAAGCFALGLQSLVDFSLQHACGLAMIALLAAARKGRSRRSEETSAARAVDDELEVTPYAGHPVGARAAFGSRIPRPGLVLALSVAIIFTLGAAAAWPGLDEDGDRLVAKAEGAKDSAELEPLVHAALEKRPADHLPLDLMATRLLSEAEGPKRALPWINLLLTVQPHGPRGHLLAGEALARLGRNGQALLEYRTAARLGTQTMTRVVEIYPDSEAILEAAPSEAEPARQAAHALAKLQRSDDAIAVASRALELSPEDEGLLQALYWFETTAGRHEEALAHALRMRGLNPESDAAWANEARALAALGRKDEARARYAEGLERLRGSTSLVFGLAQLELAEKRPAEALEALSGLSVTVPVTTRVAYHELRARAFREQRAFLKARDELRLATRLAPDREGLRIALADVLLKLDRTSEAKSELDRLGDTPAARTARERLSRQADRDRAAKEAIEAERLERAASGN